MDWGRKPYAARLNMNLREDKTTGLMERISLLWPARGQRPFIALAPVQTDKTKESMAVDEQGSSAGFWAISR